MRSTVCAARPLGGFVVMLVLGACAATPRPAQLPPASSAAVARPSPRLALPTSDAATLAALDMVLAAPHRSDANRARDVYRHPKETLAFFGLRANQVVMEIWPGAGGWYTEVLAPVLREHGRYIGAGFDPVAARPAAQDAIRAYRAKLDTDPARYDRVEVAALEAPNALAPVPPATVDLVVTFRNLHNWLGRDQAPLVLRAAYDALKPGGVLGVVDHRADPAAAVDPKAKSGYVNEQYAIDVIERVGFEFIGASEVNANPADTKNYDLGVWTLPPTFRLGDKDRERYAAIGESDRFTLRFRKPLAP